MMAPREGLSGTRAALGGASKGAKGLQDSMTQSGDSFSCSQWTYIFV